MALQPINTSVRILFSVICCLVLYTGISHGKQSVSSQPETGIIENGSNNDLRGSMSTGDSTEKVAESTFNEQSKEHFRKVLEGPNPLSFTDYNSRIYFTVTNIKNDKDHTYLKMYIINKSSSKFTVGDLILMQVEDIAGSRKSSAVINSKYIVPLDIHLPVDRSVNAGATELLGFAIPLYSGIDKGKLIIQIFEKKGSRNCKVELNAKDLTRAEIFDD